MATFDIAFNPPQFFEEYDGVKMRMLVEELERLHSILTADTDDEGVTGTVDSFNARVGDVLPIQADYDSFFLTPAEGDAAYAAIGNVVNSFEGRQGTVVATAGDYADVAETYTVLQTFDANLIANHGIFGDPGTEGTGITVNGVTYESSAKVSDIGGTNIAQMILHRHSTTLPALMIGARAKSDTSGHTIVADNDVLLTLLAAGWDGVDSYSLSSEIRFEVDGTPGANDMPGQLTFMTSPDGTEAPVERMRIRADGSVEIVDAGATDFASFSHDGTDFSTTMVNTGAWNITGANIQLNSGFDLDIRDAGTLRIRDAGDTDFAEFSHDGVDFNTAFTNTADWNFTGLTGSLKLFDSAGSEFLTLDSENIVSGHMGIWLRQNTPAVGNYSLLGSQTDTFINAPTGGVVATRINNVGVTTTAAGLFAVNAGGSFRVQDSTDSDWVAFSHDGTDFNTAFTGTADWNITSLGKMVFDIETDLSWKDTGATIRDELRMTTQLTGGDPLWSDVIFLLHVDGTDGQTTTVDSGPNTRTVSMSASAELDTAIKKFGTASCLFPDVANNAVSVTVGVDEMVPNDALTLEFNLYPNSVTTLQCIGGNRSGSDGWAVYQLATGELNIQGFGATSSRFSITSSVNPTISTWQHVAITRTSGGLWTIWLDGVDVGNASESGAVGDPSDTWRFGFDNSTAGRDLDGQLDEIRMTKGTGGDRYTTAFTPPTAAFPDGSGSASDAFWVGNTAIDTVIDGLTTRIASASTDIDGTLNVDGAATMSSLDVVGALTAASYDGILAENLLDKTATETVSGQYTHTADLLVDLGNSFTMWDAAQDSSMQMLHDGTDFSTAFTGTADWNITGLTSIQAGTANADLNDITADSLTVDGFGPSGGSAGIEISSDLPRYVLNETDAAVNNRLWYVDANGEQFAIKVSNDARSATANALTINRTGNTVDSMVYGGSSHSFEGDVTITEASPMVRFIEDDAVADNGRWRLIMNGGAFFFDALNDAESVANTILQVDRTGATVDLVTLGSDTNIAGDLLVDVNANATSNITIGESTTLRGSSQNSLLQMYGEDASVIYGAGITVGNTNLNIIGQGANPITTMVLNSGIGLSVLDSGVVRVYDSTNADRIELSETGTEAQILSSANPIVIYPAGLSAGAQMVRMTSSAFGIENGYNFRVQDATNADWGQLVHDGTQLNITTGGTAGGNINMLPAGGVVRLLTGTDLIFNDPADIDTGTFSHDGQDFLTTFTNTNDWIISGLAATGGVDVPILKVDAYTMLNMPSLSTERGAYNPIIQSIRGSAQPIHGDEEFAVGVNGISVYDNGSTGTITVTRALASTEDIGVAPPNATGFIVHVDWNGTLDPTPGDGGWVQDITSEENHTFVQIFQARITSGANLVLAENAQGTNNTSYWLTNTAGTGEYEWYARVSHCGDSGTFGTGGHIYVENGGSAWDVYIASQEVYDVTEIPDQIPTGGLIADGTGTNNTLRWDGSSWVENANVMHSAAGTLQTAGVHIAPVGGSGAPAFTFTGDLTTGMYRAGASTLGFTTAGQITAHLNNDGQWLMFDPGGTNSMYFHETGSQAQWFASDSNIYLFPQGSQFAILTPTALILDADINGTTQLSIGEAATLRGDAQDSAINLYGEQSGVIKAMGISNTGANMGFNSDGGSFQFSGNMQVLSGSTFQILDSTNSDIAQFSHDGVDFNTAFTTTADWNISGLTGDLNVQSNHVTIYSGVNEPQDLSIGPFEGAAVGSANDGRILIFGDSGTLIYGSRIEQNSRFLHIAPNSAAPNAAEKVQFYLPVQMTDGMTLTWDDDLGNTVIFSHDATDFNTVFTGTSDWNISGLTGQILLQDGAAFTAMDSGDVDWISISHSGANGVISTAGVGGGSIAMNPASGEAYVFTSGVAGTLRAYGGLGVENILMIHDNTIGQIVTSAGDVRLTSATGQVSMFKSGSNAVLKMFDTSGLQSGTIAQTTTDTTFINTNGDMTFGPSTGIMYLFKSGVNGTFRVYGSGGANNIAVNHDNTDANLTMTGTTDLNITGIAGFNVGNYSFDVDQTVGAGQDNFVLTYDNATGLISLETSAGGGGNITDGATNDAMARWDTTGGTWQEETRARLSDSGSFSIWDATTDNVSMGHDGTNFNLVGTGTTSMTIDNMNLSILDAQVLSIGSASNTNNAVFGMVGTILELSNSAGALSRFALTDGIDFWIEDPTGVDSARFDHDGTDFNLALITTTDFNITGATQVNLGGADIDDVDSIFLIEQAAKKTNVAGYGQIWVKTATPNQLWFTDDADNDVQLGLAGGNGETSVHKTADESVSSLTTVQNDDHIAFTGLDAATWYKVVGFFIVDTTSTADWRSQWVFTQTPSDTGGIDHVGNDLAGTYTTDAGLFDGQMNYTMPSTGVYYIKMSGAFKTHATTGGDLQFKWSQATSSGSNTTVKAGSWVTIVPM